MKKQTKIVIGVAVLVLILSLTTFRYLNGKGNEIEAEVIIDPLTHQQRVWMYTLEHCESKGKQYIKILDSNDKYSYGVLMFQMETFLREGKKYNILDQGITAVDGEVLIYDIELQEKIAHQMLLNGGEKNWYNCFTHKLKTRYPKNI